MSTRHALGVIAGIALAIGFVLAVVPLSVDTGVGGDQVACGTALGADTVRAGALQAFTGGDQVAACEDRVSTQRLIAFPLMGVGAVVLLFLGLTRTPVTEDESADAQTPPAQR